MRECREQIHERERNAVRDAGQRHTLPMIYDQLIHRKRGGDTGQKSDSMDPRVNRFLRCIFFGPNNRHLVHLFISLALAIPTESSSKKLEFNVRTEAEPIANS